jgi:transcriptional regulator with XRE-family HTH domain
MMDLRVVRALLRLSQAELGQRIGVDRRRVSEIEQGERQLRPNEAERVRDLIAQGVPQTSRHLLTLLAGPESDES